MKAWWSHRTDPPRRAPKKALSTMAMVLRQNFSWFLIAFIFFGSFVTVLYFGLQFDERKYHTVLISWGVSLGETWLMIEPTVVMIMIALPQLVDRAMTPKAARAPLFSRKKDKKKPPKKKLVETDVKTSRKKTYPLLSSLMMAGCSDSRPASRGSAKRMSRISSRCHRTQSGDKYVA